MIAPLSFFVQSRSRAPEQTCEIDCVIVSFDMARFAKRWIGGIWLKSR
jgi:hypothetical protein